MKTMNLTRLYVTFVKGAEKVPGVHAGVGGTVEASRLHAGYDAMGEADRVTREASKVPKWALEQALRSLADAVGASNGQTDRQLLAKLVKAYRATGGQGDEKLEQMQREAVGRASDMNNGEYVVLFHRHQSWQEPKVAGKKLFGGTAPKRMETVIEATGWGCTDGYAWVDHVADVTEDLEPGKYEPLKLLYDQIDVKSLTKGDVVLVNREQE
jgi:hypothetical protein